ncbi:MAG: hypothetical protein HQK94_18500 [Nitrospirae bacterium]|nr:hypothetical protein [Nitrospirota bacterium]
MSTVKTNTYLSKSLFMKGLQCLKGLYLQKYNSDLRAPLTESQQMLFDNGHGNICERQFIGWLWYTKGERVRIVGAILTLAYLNCIQQL